MPGLRMLSGAASNIGEVHMELNQPNQDKFLRNDDRCIYAVFDGHGEQGHLIASYLEKNLASTLADSLKTNKTTEESLRHAFCNMNEQVLRTGNSKSSGSTCAMAYVKDRTLYVAGVGDCCALLVQAHGEDLKTTSLLPVHKLSNLSEHSRVSKLGARIDGEYVVSPTDPNQVINMTRSFGDEDMAGAGIIAQPELAVVKLRRTPIVQNLTVSITADVTATTDHASENGEHSHIECYTRATISKRISADGATLRENGDHDSSSDGDSSNGFDSDGDVQYYETMLTSEGGSPRDTFLLLASDGLDQVTQDEVVHRAHQLLKSRLPQDPTADVSSVCLSLLNELEDDLYERDGVGFSDDSTILMVLLSGFCLA